MSVFQSKTTVFTVISYAIMATLSHVVYLEISLKCTYQFTTQVTALSCSYSQKGLSYTTTSHSRNTLLFKKHTTQKTLVRLQDQADLFFFDNQNLFVCYFELYHIHTDTHFLKTFVKRDSSDISILTSQRIF